MKRYFVASSADQDVTVSSQEMEHHLDECDPQACVLYSHSPSVQVYFALRNRLEKSSEAWMKVTSDLPLILILSVYIYTDFLTLKFGKIQIFL